MSLTPEQVILPDWPAPDAVRALSTTRLGGVSQAPYDSLNLGTHVADDPAAVEQNRDILQRSVNALQVQGGASAQIAESESAQIAESTGVDLQWLQQVHGCGVVSAAGNTLPEADAATTTVPRKACSVMTADCLPVLFCNRQGTQVAAAHAGWRGLLGDGRRGVLEATIATFQQPGAQLLAWLGPAIGPDAFEVGDEVYQQFCAGLSQAESCFRPSAVAGKWWADLYALARLRLRLQGVTAVYGGDICTYSDASRFFSYRRDGETGRMASLIWLAH